MSLDIFALYLGLILFITLLAGGFGYHIKKLRMVYKEIRKVTVGDFSNENLLKGIAMNQGPNFVALALAAWILLAVAFAYSYLFSPTVLPVSYFDFIHLFPGFLQIAVVGIFAIILSVICISLLPTELKLYSFYMRSERYKWMIIAACLLSVLSTWISIYLGILVPNLAQASFYDSILRIVSLLMLLVSEGILLSPVLNGSPGGMR